ncbi:MAG: T9SS type A sorting domain-containing protein, partial [Calditrichaeota bacterium]|nr:T9SS type A sorting domain-containing protein [Calditrichota bacterium]
MIITGKIIRLLIMVSVLALMHIPDLTCAQTPLCRYLFLTNFEHTRQERDIIWFWTPDTLVGPVHSNDFIGMKFTPQFHGQVSTSQNRFILYQANPYFEAEPHFGVPLLRFPEPPEFVGNDGSRIGNPEEGMQYRLVMDNEFGRVYCWWGGVPFNDEIEPLDEYFWDDYDWLYFDSPLEMYGIIDGVVTIGCSHDIKLLDDIRYAAAEQQYGRFVEDECDDMLGIISERNIIIANTNANGRDNGFYREDVPLSRHSIVINGALVAFGESFTFENQNDEWNRRQGPEPDDRGAIFLTGSIAQYRRGYVHRSNHQRTGYSKKYVHDSRLIENPPPLFPTIDERQILGEGNVLELSEEHSPYVVIGDGAYNYITASAGTEIILEDSLALTCQRSLILIGEEENPVVFRRSDPEMFPDYPGISVSGCDSTNIRHLRLENGATWPRSISPGSGKIEFCDIPNDLNINRFDKMTFRECNFGGSVEIRYFERRGANTKVSFINCKFDGSLIFNADCDTIELINCEISEDLEINRFSMLVRVNLCNIGGSTAFQASRLLIVDSQIRGEEFSVFSAGNTQLTHCDIWGDITIDGPSGRIEDCHFSGSNLTLRSFSSIEFFDNEIDNEMAFHNGRSILIQECELLHSSIFRNVEEIEVIYSELEGAMAVQGNDECTIKGNIISGGMKYESGNEFLSGLTVDNNTIVDADTAGLWIREANWFTTNNNIFYNNQSGILVETCHRDYTSNFNCSFMNTDGHYLGLIHGNFDFISDPMFVNPEGGDFNLTPESPCIDAGNPASRLDPDGTCADVGALPFDHSLSAESQEIVVNDFSVSASPNPFNNRTTISFTSRTAGIAEVDIYDLNGRIISSLLREVSRGANNLPLSGHEIGGTGMYFLRIRCDNQ